MIPARFPAVAYRSDADQVALVVDCGAPRCLAGVQEVLVCVTGLAPKQRAARLLEATTSRPLCAACQLYAGYLKDRRPRV